LIIDMLAVGYSCPTRHVPTYIIPEKEIILLGWFHRDSFKTDRLDCGETDRRADRRWVCDGDSMLHTSR